MADALGTPGGVVSDEDHRLALAGLIAPQTSTLAVRTGVLYGPGSTAILTGTSATGTMTVNVGAHHWVTSRAAGDGVYIGTKETSTTVNIAAAPGSNSRIDVVYSKQNDAGSTITPDATTAELYGVATGTAAAVPVKPAIPLGATEIGTVTVAAGATNTLGAGVTIANTAALTVARGADIPVRNQAERDALSPFWPLMTVKRLDTGSIEMRNPANNGWIIVYNAVTPPLPRPPASVTATGNTVSRADALEDSYFAVTISDPGYPYRIEANAVVRLFVNNGTRADVRLRAGAAGGSDAALPILTFTSGMSNDVAGIDLTLPTRQTSATITGAGRLVGFCQRTAGTGSWSITPGPSVYYRIVPA